MALTNIAVIDRIPPQNLEAEMALIGSILVDREMMAVVSEIVTSEDFYAHVHESIYQAMMQLYDRGEPLDKISVSEELKRRGILEKVGGLSYLSSLMDTVQSAASATYYAKIVREKATLRGLIHAGTQISQIGFEGEEDVDGALDRCEQLVYEVGSHQLSGEFVQVNRLLKPAFEQIDRLFHNRGDRTGFTTGFRDIDAMTTGLQPGNFVIIAARPGMGKTSLALNMAAASAEAEKQPVAVFSLEMTNDELVQRLICAEARLNSIDLRKGNIKPHQWEEISRAMGLLNDLPIYLDDQGAITVSEIRSRCRRLKSAHGLGAVFIDYLQLVRPVLTTKSGNRNEELSEICRTLKATAKDLAVPIVALAQLNRGVESRNDKRPMLSDLRDCLAGDALVTNADTGERIRIADVVDQKLRFNVWAADDRLNLVRRPIVDAWRVGEKQVYRVTSKTGGVIRCTAGHRFRTAGGWFELRKLRPADKVAVPRLSSNLHTPDIPIARERGGVTVAGRVNVSGITVQSDILWDSIISIEAEGFEDVYDITVGDLHNFCVDDFLTHNSGAIEQEADMVGFLYRDGYYNQESPEPDLTEFIIAKQRNGPTGMVRLRFLKEHTMFVPYGDESHYSTA